MDVNEKLFTQAYHVYVPSFGEWGFVMASISPIQWDHMEFTVPTKFFSQSTADEMIQFPNDIKLVETDINTIDTHKVIAYYEKGWESWHL
jgi:spermidine synthase